MKIDLNIKIKHQQQVEMMFRLHPIVVECTSKKCFTFCINMVSVPTKPEYILLLFFVAQNESEHPQKRSYIFIQLIYACVCTLSYI